MPPLTKIARYGSVLEVVRFSKPLVVGRRHHTIFKRRGRSKTTFKLAQNIYRTKRRIRRFVSICTQMLGTPAFATFTYAKPQHDIQQAIEDWRQFTKKMKKHYPTVSFLRVPERHKSGAVHFHAVLFGLPDDLPCESKKIAGRWRHTCPITKNCERKQRAMASLWKKGFVDLQQCRSPDSIGAYIAKYLTKGEPDWTLFGNHVASSNAVMYQTLRSARKAGIYWELSSFKFPTAVATIMEEMEPRISLKMERTFVTRWLGDARFQVFTIDSS